jgi:hypothetical protein
MNCSVEIQGDFKEMEMFCLTFLTHLVFKLDFECNGF